MKNKELTSEEVMKYDPMVKQLLRKHVLNYWGGKYTSFSKDAKYDVTLRRLGQSPEDLMQYGRIEVINQLRWYRAHGDPNKAKESTMVYFWLRNKFQSLSKSYSSAKRGGKIFNLEKEKEVIDNILNQLEKEDSLAGAWDIIQNELKGASTETKGLVRRNLCRRKWFVSNIKSVDDVSEKLRTTLRNICVTTHTSFEKIQDFAVDLKKIEFSPEDYVMAFEAVQQKVEQNKRLSKNKQFLMMKLARERGIKTQNALAKKIGMRPEKLSQILHSKAPKNEATKKQIQALEAFFKTNIEDLRKVVTK